MRRLLTCIALLWTAAPACADVVPAFVFSDHAVLQRDKPIPVWGAADAGEEVSVSFAGHTVSTVADAAGRWRVELPALPASAAPADLVIKGRNTLTAGNVVVGEVWLASGQSNMEMSVKETFDAPLGVPGSARFPMIREVRVDYRLSQTPLDKASGTWKVAGPATTGDFSAAGYYFARALYENLDVPVGIVQCTRGGSNIRGWIDPFTLESDATIADVAKAWAEAWAQNAAKYPELKAKLDADIAQWEADKAAAPAANKPLTTPRPQEGWAGLPGGPNDQGMPSGLYNGMIHPVVPYALRGAIWYQGEANVGGHAGYARIFPALITGWRARFGQGDFPFYWAQLANYNDPDGVNMAFFREAQAKALSLPNTGQAVLVDVGERHNIHPRDKQAVGRRLARLALARTYGQKVIDSGPVFASAEREGAGYRVRFAASGGQHRLTTILNTVSGFELAGADRVFRPAEAVIDKESVTVLVTSAEVTDPVAVRYAWRDAPVAGLFNREGLPAAPFRSDDWEK